MSDFMNDGRGGNGRYNDFDEPYNNGPNNNGPRDNYVRKFDDGPRPDYHGSYENPEDNFGKYNNRLEDNFDRPRRGYSGPEDDFDGPFGDRNKDNKGPSGDKNVKKKFKDNKMLILFGVSLVVLIILICCVTSEYKKKNSGVKVIVYYADMENPYCQYRLSEGKWGTRPGEKMEATSELEGFTHKIEINLAGSEYVQLCFNDESGQSDNNNGNYYTFYEGKYTVKDKVVTSLDTNITESNGDLRVLEFSTSMASPVSVGDKVELKVEASGGSGEYSYEFGYYDSKSGEKVIQEYSNSNKVTWTTDNKGTYTLYVKIKDSKGAMLTKEIEGYQVAGLGVKSISTSVQSPQYVNTMITLTTEIDNSIGAEGLECNYAITDSSGNETSLSASSEGVADWNPSSPGTYTIKAIVKDSSGRSAESSISFEIKEAEVVQPDRPGDRGDNNNRVVKIYYNNYDNAYIHYSLGDTDSWTNEPGIQMSNDSDMDNYRHVVEIDLSGYGYMYACFNDGNGAWDNRDNQNYYFEPGTYVVDNGNAVCISGNNDNTDEGDYEPSSDEITIYYKGIKEPYFHYETNNMWTNPPGIKMDKADFFSGYDYVIKIKTNGDNQIQGCFTNGDQSDWDNNGGGDFYFDSGNTYKVKNGKIKDSWF